MARHRALSYATVAVFALFIQTSASPNTENLFARSAVETIPSHEKIATPIRASVESIPLRSLREEDEKRLPLRDAVEKRPDPVDEHDILLLKTNQNPDIVSNVKGFNNLEQYYGAATYLNTGNKNNERLQQGNANLQEMQQTASGPVARRMVVCYMESWSAYRAPPLAFTAGLVPNACTHLHYAFAGIHPHTYTVVPSNEDYDIVKGGYRIATGLKKRMPGLRILISVGGEGTERLFSELVQKPTYRRAFVESAVSFLKEHDFDGLDLHWVYAGENEKDKDHLTSLLYELREKFSAYGFLLSTILPPFRYQIEDGYDIAAVSGATDYTVLQAWDMTHGKRDEPPNRALQHSALYMDPGAAARDRPYDNIEFLVKYIIRHGMAADKLVLGIPLFGRSYTLAASTLPAPGAAIQGWGDEGQYTQTKGILSYFEICMAQQEGNGASTTDEAGNTYAVFRNQWVSYDTPKTVTEKMKFVISTRLAGAAAWAIDMDDFRGLCGPSYPMVGTIASLLNGEQHQGDDSTLKVGNCDSSDPYLASDEESCAHFQFCSGSTRYKLECEDNRLYDPSTGFCGHQDATKCLPGQNLRISIHEAARLLTQAYDTDFEWNDQGIRHLMPSSEPQRIVASAMSGVQKNFLSSNNSLYKITNSEGDAATGIYIVPKINFQIDNVVDSNISGVILHANDNNMLIYKRNTGKPINLFKNRIRRQIHPEDMSDLDNIIYNKFGEIIQIPNNTHANYNIDGIDKVDLDNNVQHSVVLNKVSENSVTSAENKDVQSNQFTNNNFIFNTTVNYSENDNTNDLDSIVYNQFGEIISFPNKKPESYSNANTIDNVHDNVNQNYADFTTVHKYRDNDKRVVCYMTSWAFYRRGDGKFVPEHIDSRLCTHIVYAYASLTPDELVAKEFDPWADITNNMYERVTSLQDVKILLGLGGWTDSAGDKYSRLVSSSSARASFISKLIPFLKMHNFQGLHLDWNYPVCWQSNCKKGARSDKLNFGKFVQELSKALHAADMELGVAISGYKEVIESAYDFPAISKAADFLTAMTYDYHGGWEQVTGHHTPLTPPSKDYLPYYSIEYAVKAMISGGVDPKKLNLGLSFYGQSFRLSDTESSKGPGSPSSGPGEPGEFTKQPGMLAYYEICYRVKNLRWQVGRQNNAGPYSYQDNQWVSYDDPQSIAEKVKWALKQGLGGVTAWAIDLDDFNNRCCAEPSPLLRAAGRALGRDVPSPPSSACERPPQPVTPAPPTTTTVESDGSIVGGGSHGDHNHEHHTSTTWPSWNPAATKPTTKPTTEQSWWPAATTTTTTTTTTKRPITNAPTSKPTTGQMEDTTCTAGEYHAAEDDCEAYLQCISGRWKKNRCAPGLHWNKKANRCDWPSYSHCSASKPESEDSSTSSATTTLAPITSRPPTSTTTRKPYTTSTRKPSTTTTTESSDNVGDSVENKICNGHGYKPAPCNCNSYLHCDGTMWIMQNCAPGLHWSASSSHCDWPKYAKCDDKSSKPTTSGYKPTRPPAPTRPPTVAPSSDKEMEGSSCGAGDYHASSNDCDSYLQCVGGKWRKQLCPPGLHWDKRTMRCDWAEYAMCEPNRKTTKQPARETTTTKRPSFTRPTKPSTVGGSLRPGMQCRTGTYHGHPRCDKFYVCVNNMLIAQSCAPGLVWRVDRSQCDFPTANSCSDRNHDSEPMSDASHTHDHSAPMMQLTICENGEYAVYPGDCTRYRHCLFGKFEVYSCSSGLHWNKDKQTCDWPKSANCEHGSSTTSTTEPTDVIKPILGGPHKPEQSPVELAPQTTQVPLPIIPIATTTILPIVENKPDLLNSRYKLVCYFTNWAWYRPGIGKYGPEDIDPSLCTHVVYGFAVLGRDGLMTAHDSWADYDNRFYERVVAYKKHGIKVSLAVGGWNDSAGDKYSKLVNNPSARAKFVKHAVQFLEEYGFDGLDLDWEYPKCWQVDCSKGPDSDKDGFSALVRELSHAFKPKGFLLSSAVSPNKKVIDAGYDVPVLAQHMDWIAVMTYDYHGQWDKKTGHVAPLYYHPEDDNTYFNANYTMHYWIEKGAPPSKLVMGMPLYGQSFTMGTQWDTPPELVAKKDGTGLNVPARSGGQAGEYTRAKGFLAYYEICERLKNRGWNMVKDPSERMGPYAFKGDQWVSFDDVNIINKKVNFIKSLNLAGGMVWALDLDDFRNRCGQGKHPLLNTIKNGLLDYSNTISQSESIIKPPKVEDNDDNDIEVTPPVKKKPTTPFPQTQTPESHTTDASNAISTTENEQYKVVCYFTNWAYYRPGPGKFTPSDVDPSLCTHIIYAFAVLDGSRLVMKPHDSWTDIDNKFYEKVVAFKNHGIKVLLGLGGWNDSAGDKYSRLVNSASARRTFVVHALDFLEQYGFDGLDLDWEYPKCWQVECNKGPPSDKQGFAKFVRELRTAFTPRGLLLSAAVSPSKRVIDAGYDVPVLSKNLDWISVMTYDYHGQWDKKTGHVAPMYTKEDDDDKTFNANFTVNYWITKGADRRKLVMGIPMYGQSFSLSKNSSKELGVPTYAGGDAGDETRARGFLAFYEICERIRVRGWKVVKDPGGRIGPYATLGDQWVSFDDDFMARHKAEYVRAMNLGGGMVWALDLDDFSGKYCGCGKSPLLANINHVLRGKNAPTPCPLEEIRAPEEEVATTPTTTEIPVATETVVEHHHEPSKTDVEDINNEVSLEGNKCYGNMFSSDPVDCSKYYLCNNGRYVQLSCPSPLHWNKNHCDWPEKSRCTNKALIRLTADEETFNQPIVACYFTNWAFYRKGVGRYGPDQVDGSLCTHVIYSWAHLDADTLKLVPGNVELDIENGVYPPPTPINKDRHSDFYGKITELRLKGVKIILGAGGVEDSTGDKWRRLVSDKESRKTFITSLLELLEKWNFNGLQLSWQYPVCAEAPCTTENMHPEDRDNFGALLLELSKEFRPRNLELSVAVSANPEIAIKAYENHVLTAAVDWLAIAANDYHTAPSNVTTYLLNQGNGNSFNSTLQYWVDAISARLLVFGIPAYGRTYTLHDDSSKDIGAMSVGPGKRGEYTDVPGFLAYYEICNGIQSGDWKEYASGEGTFAVSGDQWATYLQLKQIHDLVSSARTAGIRGAALWSMDLDDYQGMCKCGPNPVLRTIKETLVDPTSTLNICVQQ